MSANAIYCEQFCTKPVGPNGFVGTADSRACCPACKQLVHWLSHDVLPSIRRHGYYAGPGANLDDELRAMLGQRDWRNVLGELMTALDLPDPVVGTFQWKAGQ